MTISISARLSSETPKSSCRRQASSVSCSSTCSSRLVSQARPRLPKRSVAGIERIKLRWRIAWSSFFSRVFWRTRLRRREIRRRSARVASLGIQTSGTRSAAKSFGQPLGVELVGLHLGVADHPHLGGVGDHDLRHVGADDPGNCQRVAGRLQDDTVLMAEAFGEEL